MAKSGMRLSALLVSLVFPGGALGFAALGSNRRRGSVSLGATTTATTVQIGKVKTVALDHSGPMRMLAHVAALAESVPALPEAEQDAEHSDKRNGDYGDRVDAILSEGWRHNDESESYVLSDSEENMMDTESARPSTYGEITPRGARQLFSHMELYDPRDDDDDDDEVVFLDVGSGLGKLVVHAYMEVPNLSESIGIEMAPSRHDAAVQGWESVQLKAQATRRLVCDEDDSLSLGTVDLKQGDMFDLDVSRVTHVYISSVCFSSVMMDRLAIKLATEATELRCVATVRPFEDEAEIFLGSPDVRYVEQTWTAPDYEEVYFYSPGQL